MKEGFQDNFKTNYLLKASLFCAAFTIIFILLSFFKSFIPAEQERLAHGIIGTIAAFLTTFAFLKYDKKSWKDIGLQYEKSTIGNFLSGILSGMVFMGLSVLFVIYYSGFKVETNPNSNIFHFLLMTLPLIPLAFMEELGFRAYPLVILTEHSGIRNSIIITSILFALYHLVNGWTIQNAFFGAGTWGILYSFTAIYSKGISMPTGMHYAANLTTSVFGVSDHSFNIWTLKLKNGDSLENYQSSEWITWIPQLSLLMFGVMLMEWWVRKQANNTDLT